MAENDAAEVEGKNETPPPEPVPAEEPVPTEEKRERVKVKRISVISFGSFLFLSLIVSLLSICSLFYTHNLRREIKPKVENLERGIKETNYFVTMVDEKVEKLQTETTESFEQTIVVLRYLCETHGRKVNDVVEMIFRMAWKDDWKIGKTIMDQYLRTGRQDLWDMTMKRLSAKEVKELLGVELPGIFRPNISSESPGTSGTW